MTALRPAPRADPMPLHNRLRHRPRVLHVTTTDISHDLLLGNQYRQMLDLGYEIVAASAPGPHVEAVEKLGVTFVPIEHATRAMSLGEDARALAELVRLFRRLRPDIVHTHNPKPGVYGRIAARLANVPVVVNTVHGLYATPEDALAKRTVVYALERIAGSCSQAELLQNPEDLPVLRRLRVPRSKLVVLGNGIDLARFDPDDVRRGLGARGRDRLRADLGAGPDDVLVGLVGRLVGEKGYHEVVDAAIALRRDHPELRIRFVIVGPHEPDKADALDPSLLARGRADGAIHLAGMRDDVDLLYAAMDLFVLASHREGFPRSAMEAAAMGLPSVLTDIRGCRQVVVHGETGLLVPPRDPDALADAIATLASSADARARMGAAAIERARQSFDDRTVVARTVSTYERLLRSNGILGLDEHVGTITGES